MSCTILYWDQQLWQSVDGSIADHLNFKQKQLPSGDSVAFGTGSFSPQPFPISLHAILIRWVVGGWGGDVRDDSVDTFFSHFSGRPQCVLLVWAGTSTLWCCPSSISSADHDVAHPRGVLKDCVFVVVVVVSTGCRDAVPVSTSSKATWH